MTNVQLPGIVRKTFCVKKIIETVFPEPWVCQKTPSLRSAVRRRLEARSSRAPAIRAQRVVHAEVLVVARDELDEPTGQLLEDDEVPDDVEEALRCTFLG